MKFKFKLLNIVTMAALIFCAGVILRESNKTAAAAISLNNPLPSTWVGAGGTNAFTLNASAVLVITYRGTNLTAITTNFPVLRGETAGAATTNNLRIVNGVIVGIY
jgi:hypothetical protein